MRYLAGLNYCYIKIELATTKDCSSIVARSLEIPSKRLRNHSVGFEVSLAIANRSRQNRGSTSSAQYV